MSWHHPAWTVSWPTLPQIQSPIGVKVHLEMLPLTMLGSPKRGCEAGSEAGSEADSHAGSDDGSQVRSELGSKSYSKAGPPPGSQAAS